MHAVDLINCVNGMNSVNGGTTYCPNLSGLTRHGVQFLEASTSKPSDSFPGLTALVSGGSPRTEGVFYDVAYDRVLAPPATKTGNGLNGGACTRNTPNGTSTEYEEGIDIDQLQLGGKPNGNGGEDSIDPMKLPRDPYAGCNSVFPWNFVRTNTIFGVIHGHGGYTAWSDKHPAYASVSGPGDGTNIDDFFSPEINSLINNFPANASLLSGIKTPSGVDCTGFAQSFPAGSVWTDDFTAIQCYDTIKVNAILNEIRGLTHDGSKSAPVPDLFGMNFQALSVGQKLIEGSRIGGYLDNIGTPGQPLLGEIQFVDTSIGTFVTALKNQGLLDSTVIVISAKHGQSPIDPNRVLRIPGDASFPSNDLSAGKSPVTIISDDISGAIPDSELNQIGPTEDDVSLIWLSPGVTVASAVADLESKSPVGNNIAGIGEIYSGASLAQMFNPPGVPSSGDLFADGVDPRTPDIVVTPNIGVIYTGHDAKLAEHGGFSHDDTNSVLMVSASSLDSSTVTSPVENMQVAPTILKILGLNPSQLQAVRQENTKVLPGLESLF
ncbi:MAG: alkaline phosphatase family protein [Deltaproteobacteria bacterium]|nr:alkaline phosphatase family protein [Deltaproteobacteria bacterium]